MGIGQALHTDEQRDSQGPCSAASSVAYPGLSGLSDKRVRAQGSENVGLTRRLGQHDGSHTAAHLGEERG